MTNWFKDYMQEKLGNSANCNTKETNCNAKSTINNSPFLEHWSTNVSYVESPSDAAYLIDPYGVFTCDDLDCSFNTRRYTEKSIPDVILCPLCGRQMINKGIIEGRTQSLERMKIAGAGNPDGLSFAIKAYSLFCRTLAAENKTYFQYIVPELDYILDVAGKVRLNSIEDILSDKFLHIELEHYPFSLIEKILKLQSISNNFIENHITSTPTKQVELVPILKNSIEVAVRDLNNNNPSFSDHSWYFYVWRQFGLVSCLKQGRYNMIYKE